MARTPDGPVDPADLLRQFQEQLAGLDLATMASLAQRLVSSGPGGYGPRPVLVPRTTVGPPARAR